MKITADHLVRGAFVYVRRSTTDQLATFDQLRAQEEHPVKEQYRVCGGRGGRRGQSGIRVDVVDRVLVSPVAGTFPLSRLGAALDLAEQPGRSGKVLLRLAE